MLPLPPCPPLSSRAALSTPGFSTPVTSYHVVHSRLIHPCHLVPCCPLPRFQRPLYVKLTVKNKKNTTRIRNLINDVSNASVVCTVFIHIFSLLYKYCHLCPMQYVLCLIRWAPMRSHMRKPAVWLLNS